MPTDNSRMVFFPSMLAKYSTVGFVWRMLRRLPYSLPFPVLADGFDKLCPSCRVQVPRIRAMRLPCRQHAFLCAGLYAHPRLRPPPAYLGPQHRALFKFHTKNPLAASGVHPRPRARAPFRKRKGGGQLTPR